MKQVLFLVIAFSFLSFDVSVFAQDWTRRHAFAKAYFGVDANWIPQTGSSQFLNLQNQLQSFDQHASITPSINIGATHFWGYADFFVSISTVAIKFQPDEIANSLRLGAMTGMRLYPLALGDHKIRPFVGYKFSPFRYRQSDIHGASYKFTQVKSMFELGLGYQLPNLYITAGVTRVMNPAIDIYVSRNQITSTGFPPYLVQLGINYLVETTALAGGDVNKQMNQTFSASNAHGFFLAAGPSSAFPTVSSAYVREFRPFLDNKSFPVIFPDLALGYHFTKTDLITALSFRPINQKRAAFNFEQEISRNSLILEAYKFLVDYHGFVPYIGLGLGLESIGYVENELEEEIQNRRFSQLSPALVFGWDIRPSIKGDWWLLRTNLRYYPFLGFSESDHRISLQHLEFNFIQFVIYPQRLKLTRKFMQGG